MIFCVKFILFSRTRPLHVQAYVFPGFLRQTFTFVMILDEGAVKVNVIRSDSTNSKVTTVFLGFNHVTFCLKFHFRFPDGCREK